MGHSKRTSLTYISLASFLLDIGKHNSPRCDAAKRGVLGSDHLIFMGGGGGGAGRFFEKNIQDSDKDKQNRQDDQANKKNIQDGVKKR